jgi:Aminotransferase class I and II
MPTEFKSFPVQLTAACLQGRVACLQSLSGTGSLRVGAAFIVKWLPGKDIYISNPTWGNHRNIFSDAGLEWKYYRYFNPDTIGLDFDGMMEDIKNAPDGSVIVLHGAHTKSLKCLRLNMQHIHMRLNMQHIHMRLNMQHIHIMENNPF